MASVHHRVGVSPYRHSLSISSISVSLYIEIFMYLFFVYMNCALLVLTINILYLCRLPCWGVEILPSRFATRHLSDPVFRGQPDLCTDGPPGYAWAVGRQNAFRRRYSERQREREREVTGWLLRCQCSAVAIKPGTWRPHAGRGRERERERARIQTDCH